MAIFVLIHGASANSHYWYLVKPILEQAGHTVIAPDLPTGDKQADFNTYAASVTRIMVSQNKQDKTIIVGQSMGAYTAPIVAQDVSADLIILVDPMIPAPHESPAEWGHNTKHQAAMIDYAAKEGFDPSFDMMRIFMHDVPQDILKKLMQAGEPEQAETIFSKPFPLDTWPNISTKVFSGTLDRMFPIGFVQKLARERLGVENVGLIESGHLPAFSQPKRLAEMLLESID